MPIWSHTLCRSPRTVTALPAAHTRTYPLCTVCALHGLVCCERTQWQGRLGTSHDQIAHCRPPQCRCVYSYTIAGLRKVARRISTQAGFLQLCIDRIFEFRTLIFDVDVGHKNAPFKLCALSRGELYVLLVVCCDRVRPHHTITH